MARSFDLNLIPVLIKIYEHGSVSAAAAQLGMSQSAISGALAKLREIYSDPLFHRVGHGMRPTARMVDFTCSSISGRNRLTERPLHTSSRRRPGSSPLLPPDGGKGYRAAE